MAGPSHRQQSANPAASPLTSSCPVALSIEIAAVPRRRGQSGMRSAHLAPHSREPPGSVLAPELRCQHPRHSFRLARDSESLSRLVEFHGKAAIAEHVEHHVHVVEHQFLALLVAVGLLRKDVEIEPHAVPGKQCVALRRESGQFDGQALSPRPATFVLSASHHRFSHARGSARSRRIAERRRRDAQRAMGSPIEVNARNVFRRLDVERQISPHHANTPFHAETPRRSESR